MVNGDSNTLLGVDEVYVYAGQSAGRLPDDSAEEQVRFGRRGATPLAIVRQEDTEL